MSFNNPEKTKISENLIIWDFYTKEKLRIFNLKSNLTSSFQFSPDSNYVSGIREINNENFLFVYELPSMKVIEDPKTKERSQLPVANPISCYWANTKNELAVLSIKDTSANSKAEIAIYNIPTRTKINW